MGWGAFLVAISGSVAKRVLAALGIGMVTYVGFTAMKAQVDAAVDDMLTGMPSDIYQLIALGGFVDAMGIWLGALTTVIALMAFSKLAPLGS